MVQQIPIKLGNGVTLYLNLEDSNPFFAQFIEKFLKPLYLKSNDWNASIKEAINECERISVLYNLKRGDLISSLLSNIEGRLARDIAELTGVDKIEIIFEGIEDYVSDITKAVQAGTSQEEIRMRVSSLVQNLNLFEISELLIFFAKGFKK